MTDAERIEQLEKRLSELEIRLSARADVVLGATAASAGIAVDALALIALLDRPLVENLLRARRISHQRAGSSVLTAELLKRYDMALDIADQLSSSRPLGPV